MIVAVKKPIEIGSSVRLRRRISSGYRQVTVVRGFLPDIAGGVVLADALEQSRCWNIVDLERVRFSRRRASKKRSR